MPRKRMDECEILTRYLVGRSATSALRASYMRALQIIPIRFTEPQAKQWNACLKNPVLLSHLDAWLGFSHPEHPIRKKIFIMVSLLETQPDYSDFFLPSRSSFLQVVAVAFTGMWAVIKIFTGRIVTWIL